MHLSAWFPLLLVGAVLAQASASTSVAEEAERKASKVKPFRLDGVNVDSLSQKDLAALLEAEDEKLAGEIDIWTGKRDLALLTKGGRKRWLPALFTLGRTLLQTATVRGGVTRSGIRRTRQYDMPGGYLSALGWFIRLKPTNVRSLSTRSKFWGYTGRMGERQVTVRSGSSGGEPTLEIRSPKTENGQFVHKFRFQKKRRSSWRR